MAVLGSVLVVPCFNEAQRWDVHYWSDLIKISAVEWMFVNDGSTDDTLLRLQDLASNSKVQVLDLGTNSGKGEAVRIGMLKAIESRRGSPIVVGFMDADGAFQRSDIEHFAHQATDLIKLDAADALWSSRVALAGRSIQRSQRRHYLGRLVATFLAMGYEPLPYDTQAGLKFFRLNETFLDCIRAPFLTRWLFEVEILQRWRELTGVSMRVREEPLEYWRDVAGSSITRQESIRIARELWRVKRMQLGRSRNLSCGDSR